MKIEIIASKHAKNEPDINSLIGKIFEAEYENSVLYITSGGYSGVYLKNGEYKIIE